jgi:hypothetical protein
LKSKAESELKISISFDLKQARESYMVGFEKTEPFLVKMVGRDFLVTRRLRR